MKPTEAVICLYGSHECGAGWIAVVDGRSLGDGEPRAGATMTAAIHAARDALLPLVDPRARLTVFAPGGRLAARVAIDRPIAFGRLAWIPAPVWTISAADVMAAAEEQKR